MLLATSEILWHYLMSQQAIGKYVYSLSTECKEMSCSYLHHYNETIIECIPVPALHCTYYHWVPEFHSEILWSVLNTLRVYNYSLLSQLFNFDLKNNL